MVKRCCSSFFAKKIVVGYALDELKKHLEKQFANNMTWENYGRNGWHIDHIRPCASFDLSEPAQQRECFHYSNLQPLWAKDNLAKGKKLLTNRDDTV